MPGDFIGHATPLKANETFDQSAYDELMMIHGKVADLLAKYLPKTMIIPSYGNNDWLFHYQYPAGEHKEDFLTKMFNNWFQK